jgi:hypothetical protein
MQVAAGNSCACHYACTQLQNPTKVHSLSTRQKFFFALITLLEIRVLTRLQVRTDNIISSRTEGKPPYVFRSLYINMHVTDDVTSG